jgi:hypothetical protein
METHQIYTEKLQQLFVMSAATILEDAVVVGSSDLHLKLI